MSDISDLKDTIIPNSNQLNAEQLLGGPMTITITGVRRGSDDQPVILNYEGDEGRPYKPCKSMRKVLIFAWGDDGREWIGKSMTLYNNPEVKFGGVKVGGIRISHLSDVERDIALSLTATKGKKENFTIKKLVVQKKQAPVKSPEADPAPNVDISGDIIAINECETMDELKKVFSAAQKDWKAAGIDASQLIEAKDRKKAELSEEAPI